MIGNPPYIQLQDEGGKLAKLYRQAKFNTFSSMGDIYQLFYEKGIVLLKKKGHLCYITSNKWMRAGYGETSRKYFAEQSQPKILIDLAGEKVFENATVDVNILLLQKTAYTQSTCALRGGLDCLENRRGSVQQSVHSIEFPKNGNSWVILSDIEQRIKQKIEAVGRPLKEWDIKIYRGILTGCNDAFIINKEKRDELIKKCPKSAEIIRPILRGRDIKRYGYDFADTVEGAVAEADFVTLHMPSLPETKGMINNTVFHRMKRTAYFINCARGDVVNENDLYTALNDKQIAGAAVDVLGTEPMDASSPLMKLGNFIVTPHSAGQTREATEKIVTLAAEGTLAVLHGEKWANVCNPEVYETSRWKGK